MKWSELLRHCEHTKRTSETVAEYAAMDRERQGAIKDVGGFVGGRLAGGKRRNGSVECRSCATLDIDFGHAEVWNDFLMLYDCAALMYSTHKHTPEAPRLRLVIPFDRPARPDEYEPVCRRIAAEMGMQLFDRTTFQLPRLFYWPSTPADGEYVFEWQDGPPLSVDGVLASYADWRDPSQWPRADDEATPRLFDDRRADDPRQKPGIIGAFCRAYSIEEAIDHFLRAVYDHTRGGRYTYTGGTTTGGLVCYDHLFAYSNHGSDPAHGRLLNAFDLVRVHLYGHLDGGRGDDDVTALPSYEAMCSAAAADERVRALLADENRRSLADDFGSVDLEAEPAVPVPAKPKKPSKLPEAKAEAETTQALPIGLDVPDHIARVRAMLPAEAYMELELGKGSTPLNTGPNAEVIIRNHPALCGRIYYDVLAGRIRVAGELPWARMENNIYWDDFDSAGLRSWLAKYWKITKKEVITDAINTTAMANRRNPLREYFEALRWDGQQRLDRIIIDYIGAADTELNRAITRIHFAAAVARIYEPGFKYDYCLIFQGPQGCGKSTFIKIMGGEYYREGVTVGTKDACEEVRGCSLVELGELTALSRYDLGEVKKFITGTEDDYRRAYGTFRERPRRTCVFFGTSNDRYILRDPSGARRFPIIVAQPELRRKGDQWFATLEAERDQIWAEAVDAYKRGTPSQLPDKLWKEMLELQDDFTDDDGMAELRGDVEAFLETLLPDRWSTFTLAQRRDYFRYRDPSLHASVRRPYACAAEYLREWLGKDPAMRDYKTMTRKVNRAFEELGWIAVGTARYAASVHGRQKSYKRPGLMAGKSDDEEL